MQSNLKGKAKDSHLELVRGLPLASIKSGEHLEEGIQPADDPQPG